MKRSVIMIAFLALLVGLLSGVGVGHAGCNTAGSCESSDNQVTCGGGQDIGLGTVTASDKGAEACNDGSGAAPIQGRIGTEGPDCDCVYADGDADNDSHAQGWLRVDQNGLSCSIDGAPVSYNDGGGGSGADCAM
ncbi:MAG: hypothetical protein ABR548_10760 [Actinomycetota bacterium]|nr:hypothetical protein [Actinomycetota bacterium]